MIGILDSGLGGLAVATWTRRLLPDADIRYVADQAHAPYGDRDPAEVAARVRRLVASLVDEGAATVVLASNTISAAALHRLRAEVPDVAFVGMEPAIKPAVARTRSGVIAVLGTTATIEGPLLADMVARHAAGTTVVPIALPGLVDLVEAGKADSPETAAFLAPRLRHAREAGADTWVLACTHYSFVVGALVDVVGEAADVIDPAEAVARQVARVDPGEGSGSAVARTTGSPEAFALRARDLGAMPFQRVEPIA